MTFILLIKFLQTHLIDTEQTIFTFTIFAKGRVCVDSFTHTIWAPVIFT